MPPTAHRGDRAISERACPALVLAHATPWIESAITSWMDKRDHIPSDDPARHEANQADPLATAAFGPETFLVRRPEEGGSISRTAYVAGFTTPADAAQILALDSKFASIEQALGIEPDLVDPAAMERESVPIAPAQSTLEQEFRDAWRRALEEDLKDGWTRLAMALLERRLEQIGSAVGVAPPSKSAGDILAGPTPIPNGPADDLLRTLDRTE